MQYRKDKYGNDISILGYGCMRFSSKFGRIDTAKAEKEIMLAIEGGINYFDTAYIYPGSEEALGSILAKNNVRDKVKIASKLPHYLVKDLKAAKKIFDTELARLKTDHIDYYLIHMLPDKAVFDRLENEGIFKWLKECKKDGRIGQLGFSYHGNSEEFIRLVDSYDWDFCQVQYNYVDVDSQAGRKGVKYAASKGLPVIIMEPLRGGQLANDLPQSVADVFAAHPSKRSPAEWSFRWLWDQPEITCVLSGMNSEEMVGENIAAASEARSGEFGQAEREMFEKASRGILEATAVPCTGCGYCSPCPHGVDIPGVFSVMNRAKLKGKGAGIDTVCYYIMNTALRSKPACASQCVKCGLCEKKCPQHIKIRDMLEQAQNTLEKPFYYKPLMKIMRVFMQRKSHK